MIALGICGNKSDLHANEAVDENDAIEYCNKVGAEYAVVSAATGDGVQDFFKNLMEKCYKAYENLDPKEAEREGYITLGDKTKGKKSKKCC